MRTQSRTHATVAAPGPSGGVRERTYRQLLSCAMQLAQDGRLVTVAEVATAAGVGRATAYRYFASRGELIAAIVEQSLGPVRRFESNAVDGRARLQQLFVETFPRFKEFEPHMRAALQLSLEHWALARSGKLAEKPYRRGHRVAILERAAAPLKTRMPATDYRRLLRALSVVYGIEPYVVLKDIWGSSNREVDQIARWMANALVDAAVKGARGKRNDSRNEPLHGANGRSRSNARVLRRSAGLATGRAA